MLMNDNDLIDELRDGMRARTDHTQVPHGFADHARQTARRRSARRAAAAGTPLLAAAGVATLLATSAGSGGGSASSSLRGAQAPNLTVGGGHAQDTAYIVKRVTANVAADSQNGSVIHSVDYRTGEASSDGSLVNLGRKVYDEFKYAASDGTEYSRDTYYNKDGSVQLTGFDTYVPGAKGQGTDTETVINPASREYSQTQYPGTSDPDRGPTPDLFSTPSQVQRALQSGQVTHQDTATVDGAQAITLSVAVPAAPDQTAKIDLLLYVDAQSYQPLRTVQQVNGSNHVLSVEDWMPATPDNIAPAKNDSIPAGYTKAAPNKVY
jgi:hypothetical protein